MQLQAETKPSALSFDLLPAFAAYLLDQKLEDFVRLQFRITGEEGLAMRQQLAHLGEDELLQIGRDYSRDLLTHLAENRTADFIRERMAQWEQNLLFFDRYSVAAADIAKLSFIRKRAFLGLLADYCGTELPVLELVGEIDRLFLQYDTAALEVLTALIERQAADRSLFIAKVNSTLPGAVYIFDTASFRNVYANEGFAEVMGYTSEELNRLRDDAVDQLVHPDDVATVRGHLEAMRGAPDGNILSYEYRLLGKDGHHRWFHCYESVFRRDADGVPSEIIAICFNVDAGKETAEQLRVREEQLLEAQSIAQIGSFYWEMESNISTRTPELVKILETADPGYDFFQRVHPGDRQRVEADIRSALDSGRFDSEYRYQASTGIKQLWSCGVVHYRDGKAFAISGTVMDITQRKALLHQAEESERLYKEVEALAGMGTWYWDESLGELRWTDNLYRLYGLEPQSEAITSERFLSFVHPDDRPAIEESMQKGYPEEVADYTFRIRRGDGSVRVLRSLAQVERDADGRLLRVFGYEKDITGQQETERRIAEQDYFIQHLADASPMVLYLFDIPSGRFQYLNREIFYVLGYTPEEILELDAAGVEALYHPDDLGLRPERAGSESRFRFSESMMQYECRLRKKGGDWYWLLAREIVFRKDEAGKVQQILGAALDINRRKEMERSLLQSSFQLEQSNASLEEFAYVASHDLKEPLRKISTFGDRLVASQMDRMTDDGKIYLKKVVDASQRMQTMIDDLLSVSRISGDRGFERVSLQSLLEDALQTLEFKIEQAGAKVLSDGLPEAEVVPSQFRQLFQNLLSNSIKFAREATPPEVAVHYRYLRPDEVAHLSLRKAPQYLQLSFRDNGIGFENEYAGKIFQIFQRLHGRSEYEGNGIGLAIVKKIVEHHGGAIGAEGDPGRGAVFTLTLPL